MSMTTSNKDLTKFENRQFSEKWVKATDAEEQRKILSDLVFYEKLDAIKILIELGVNPNVHNQKLFRGNNDDKSLLRVSIERRHWRVARLLLEYGADPHTSRIPYVLPSKTKTQTLGSNLSRVVHNRYDTECSNLVDLMIKKGADLKAYNTRDGNSTLHSIIKTSSKEWFNFFARKYPKQFLQVIDVANNSGQSPLSVAIEKFMKERKKVADKLLAHTMALELLGHPPKTVSRHVIIPGPEGKTDFENRAIFLLLNELEKIFRFRKEKEQEYKNLVKLVSSLIDDPEILKQETADGDTPAHYFASFGLLNLLKMCSKKQLLQLNNKQWSCLHFSAERGCFDCILYLLETVPESVNFVNSAGQTAVDVAEENKKWLCAEKMIEFLDSETDTEINDDTSLEFEYEDFELNLQPTIPAKKCVHFGSDKISLQKAPKLETLLDELRNRPEKDVIGSLEDIIDHQARKIEELLNHITRQETQIKNLSTEN